MLNKNTEKLVTVLDWSDLTQNGLNRGLCIVAISIEGHGGVSFLCDLLFVFDLG